MMLTAKRLRYLGTTLLAWVIVLALNFPLLWMLSSSFKSLPENNTFQPTLLPKKIDFENYSRLMNGDFWIWIRNSAVVSLSTVALVTVLATLAAYSLTRFRYPGQRPIAIVILFTYMFPSVLMLVPIFLIISYGGLSNTYFALIFASTTFALPFSIWLLQSYFQSVPVEVEQAAMMDGASRLEAFVEVVVPQAAPGLLSTAIFAFILAWDEYLFASVFISSPAMKTVPIGIATYANELTAEYGVLMAASVCVTMPVLVLFAIMQKRLLPDLSGSTKG